MTEAQDLSEQIDEHLQKQGIDRRTLNFILFVLGLCVGLILGVSIR